MAPSDELSDKIPTRTAKKPAQTKSREVDVPKLAEFAALASPEDRAEAQPNSAHVERLMDAFLPIWPGKRNSWEIARHFALSRRGLDLTKEEWRVNASELRSLYSPAAVKAVAS
jgi:hypothetical protein